MIRVINDRGLWQIIEDAKNSKIILYIDSKYERPMRELLSLVDVKVAYSITDEQAVYDLLYEKPDEIMVIAVRDEEYQAKRLLEGLGLRAGIHFKTIQNYSKETNAIPYHYDPLLGYNLDTEDEKTRGFRVFGNIDDRNNVKIVTLGGSTTDAYLYPYKSWSEYLHEILVRKNIPNVVICGGVAGYSSGEELFKLIRDGFAFSPDWVINYSGFNDLGLMKYPYINEYMRQTTQFLRQQDTKYSDALWGVNGSYNETVEDNYKFWMNNESMINTLCEAKGIHHATFFQPSLFNECKKITSKEQSYLLNLVYAGSKRFFTSDFAKKVKKFVSYVQRDLEKYEWLYDLSKIFCEEEIYNDLCHVNELGNQMIAEAIFAELEIEKIDS